MTEDKSSLTGFYSRAKDDDWHEQKQDNHRRWRRRTLGIGSVVAAAVLVGGFIIYDYPRESGLTDALGMTCGEYVELGESHSLTNPMNDWETHQEDLLSAEDFDGEGFLSAVDALSEELDAEPQMGLAYEAITQREFSAAAVGDDLVIGHHEEFWSVTDRVSLLDPSSGDVSWTAELEYPGREGDLAGEERPQVLFGVGTTDEQVVLQTPTYQGDTDLVISSRDSEGDSDCVRLDGSVDTVEVLSANDDRLRAWSQTLNLNAASVSGSEFVIHHGAQEDSPQHDLSVVDIATEEVNSDAELPSELSTDVEDPIIPDAAQDAGDEELQQLSPIGPDHYLLTWEFGHLVFATQ